MTDTADAPAKPERNRRAWGEIAVVVVLGLTALATAWSSYQASLWSGIQSSNYSQASGARTNAAQQRTEANQFRMADLSLFETHINALITDEQDVADFYRERFRPEFVPAYEAWIAEDPFTNPDAPRSPFVMPEYTIAQDANAEELEAKADKLFADGELANTYSDTYTLTTLLFAAVLFFAAVADRFRSARARVSLLVLAVIGLIAGISVAAGQPITAG
jgi:hypothetical protein